MKEKKEKNPSKRNRRIVVCSVLGAAAAALLVFWGLFYIRQVEVVGNTRYTAEEIEEMVIRGFLDHNSVFLSVFHKQVDLEDVPFLESAEVEYLGRDRVRLFVTEKNPIGYVRLNEIRYYFDQDGLVLEAVHESETAGTGETAPALSDVPPVEGLPIDSAAVGETLKLENMSVFNTIQALDRMMEKYQMQPDSIQFDGDLSVTLRYGEIRVILGADTDLEEKMSRAASILPELQGMRGSLHLEDYTEDTQNIVFSQE